MENKLLYFFAFLSVMVFARCNEIDIDKTISDYNLPNSILEKVDCENGIISFSSIEDYNFVLTILDTENSKWNIIQLEEQNEEIPKVDFNDEFVLDEFEEMFNYKSMRSKIKSETKKWLNNLVLDFENDPDDYIIADNIVRTLLNEENELIIGNSIFKLDPNTCNVYEILDHDFSALLALKLKKDISDNIILHSSSNLKSIQEDDCKANASASEVLNWKTDYLIKCKLSVNNIWPFIHNVKASQVYYKFVDGKWEDIIESGSSQNKIEVFGTLRDTDCDNPDTFSQWEEGMDVKYSNGTSFRAKSGEVKSRHHYGQPSSYELICTATLLWE